MKVLIQSVKNGEWVKVWDDVSMVTYKADGTPELHRRRGEKVDLNPTMYKIVSIS